MKAIQIVETKVFGRQSTPSSASQTLKNNVMFTHLQSMSIVDKKTKEHIYHKDMFYCVLE